MAKLRREVPDPRLEGQRRLRIIGSGTLFITQTLSTPTHPEPSTVVRAQSVTKSRGGSASNVLSLLAQFEAVDAALVAALSGNQEGRMILDALEKGNVSTRYCKIWDKLGVPTAWVLDAADTKSRTVINHNPLPEITHEEFVSMLGPLLIPENYAFASSSPTSSPTFQSTFPQSRPRASSSSTTRPQPQGGEHPPPWLPNPNSPAPFDFLYFEGRSVKTTLSNITGLDGLARERKWRSHCVFSLDIGRKGTQGVEALIPHADVIFFNEHYARANSENPTTLTPRAFLLSMSTIAPAHSLLVVHWGTEGAAVLSIPTQEYYQSSAWVPLEDPIHNPVLLNSAGGTPNARDMDIRSVQSGSDFWAGGRSYTPSSSAFTSGQRLSGYTHTPGASQDLSATESHIHRYNHSMSTTGPFFSPKPDRHQRRTSDEDDNDSQGTEVPGSNNDDVIDPVGAKDAFIAGMIYALSRRLAPGGLYSPSFVDSGPEAAVPGQAGDTGKWRLDECLRFATELSGRKARRRNWDGLGDEMMRAGWFTD